MPTCPNSGPRPPGSSRCNSVSPSLGEFITSRPSASDSVVGFSVEDDYRHIGHDRYLPDDPQKQRENFENRDRQNYDSDFSKRYCDPQPDRYNKPMNRTRPDVYAIERVEDDTEHIFAFKPPTTAELRIIEQDRVVQVPVAAALVPQDSMDHHLGLARFRDYDLRTLVDYPGSPPRAAFFYGPDAPFPPIHHSASDSYCQSSTLQTSRAHDSSVTRQSPLEDHKSSQTNKGVKHLRKTQRDILDDDRNENDNPRNSAASFDFETDSFDEESLKYVAANLIVNLIFLTLQTSLDVEVVSIN